MNFVRNAVDRSMAELYTLADSKGSPCSLVDYIIATMKKEKLCRNFSPFSPMITKRDVILNRVRNPLPTRHQNRLHSPLKMGRVYASQDSIISRT
jgi:hypothetical protein